MTVLIYHDVVARERRDEAGFPGELAARYKLDPEHFESHLDAIAETGRSVGLLTPGTPAPDVVLTFDDGGASAPETARALERRGWRGHFFVITGNLGSPGFMTEEEVRELDRRGHRIGSHSHSHPASFAAQPRDRLRAEWERSRDHLTELLGRPPSKPPCRAARSPARSSRRPPPPATG